MITPTRLGPLHAPSDRADLIGQSLAINGEWAWDEVTFLASILPRAPRVLDAGAFIGTFGLGLASLKRSAWTCFVEANREVVPLLRANVAAHAPDAAVVVEALLTGSSSTSEVGWARAGNLGSTSFAGDAEGAIEIARPASSVSLADLRARHGPFDLVKLDLEGLEHAVLHADAAALRRGDTAIWAECNNDPQALALADLLLSWPVRLYYFAFPSHNPDNTNGNAVPLLPMAYEAGLLAAPRVRPELSADLARHGCILRDIRSVDDLRSAMWRTPRWGLPGWDAAEKAEVAALAGHLLRNERFEDFLIPGWDQQPSLAQRVEQAEAALAEAKALAVESGAALSREQLAHACTLDAFREAQRLAFEGQAAVTREHTALVEAVDVLRAVQSSLKTHESDLVAEQRARAAAEQALADERSARHRHPDLAGTDRPAQDAIPATA